jgi:predicted anti-sigma-YlaC factor YlaD
MTSVSPLTCEELVDLVTDYLEEKLPLAEHERFEAHLGTCPGCRTYLDQIRTTIRVTGSLTEESIPTEARDRLLDSFRDWKRGE